MSKTKKLSKVLALVIMLALVIGILPMGVMATNSYTDFTMGNFTFQFGDPTDPQYANTSPEIDLVFTQSGNTINVGYNGPITNYYPDQLAFYITAGASDVTSMSGTGVTIAPTEYINGNYEITTNINAGFYVLYIDTTTAGTKTMTFSDGTTDVTINFIVPSTSTVQSDTIYAYLPAPAQFANEGVTTGGWGDAYTSGSASIKNMVDNLAGTGVSLGYFGGYVVIDLQDDIYDSPENMYGIDFIVYGNPFIGNAEPGCLQVSPDGEEWYDIAGSLHYDPDTAWDAEFTYTNPYPSDDASVTIPTAGYYDANNPRNNDVHYICTPNDGAGLTGNDILYNAFHRHAWFPLWANYFIGRGTDSAMAKASFMDSSGDVTLANLPFAKYYKNTTTGSKLTLTGVMLGDVVNTQTGTCQFGYADVHPKNNSNYYEYQYNPYVLTSTTVSNVSNWNNFLSTACNGSPAGGGDPIDIAWAVYPSGTLDDLDNDISGQPADLEYVRYIRIYTGAASMNPSTILGEISTEVCGVFLTSEEGDGEGGLPTVTFDQGIGNIGLTANDNETTVEKTGLNKNEITLTVSNATNVYINGIQGNTLHLDLTDNAVHYVQIIAQSGTESPYIVLLLISK